MRKFQFMRELQIRICWTNDISFPLTVCLLLDGLVFLGRWDKLFTLRLLIDQLGEELQIHGAAESGNNLKVEKQFFSPPLDWSSSSSLSEAWMNGNLWMKRSRMNEWVTWRIRFQLGSAQRDREFVVIKYHVGLTGLGEALDPVQEWNFSLKLDSKLVGQSASLMTLPQNLDDARH